MKFISLLLLGSLFTLPVLAQKNTVGVADQSRKPDVVEASCGKCKFGLPGKTCALAVKIGDNAYYVNGASIDDFGDAHAHDGFCNAVRKAEVQGELVNDEFRVRYFKLLPVAKRTEAKNSPKN